MAQPCLADFEWVDPTPVAKGAYGVVFHAIYRGCHVALKRVNKTGDDTDCPSRARFLNELDIHTTVRHPCILRVVPPGFFESSDPDGYLYLVTEYCANGDLHRYMRAQEGGLHEDVAACLFYQLVAAVAHLHDRGIIHRDIKLRNLLLTDKMALKLGDFGLATQTSRDDTDRHTVCGTPSTAAPEVLPGGSYDLQCDLWSMGCVLFTMLTGASVLARSPDASKSLKHARRIRSDYNEKLAPLSAEAQDIIRKLLQVQAQLRPSAGSLLAHPFIARFNGSLSLPLLPRALSTSGAFAGAKSDSFEPSAGLAELDDAFDEPEVRSLLPQPAVPPEPPRVSSRTATAHAAADVASSASGKLRSRSVFSSSGSLQSSGTGLSSSVPSSVTCASGASVQSSTAEAVNALTASASLESELRKLNSAVAANRKHVLAKRRQLRRAFESGTGADGDTGACGVLSVYAPQQTDASAGYESVSPRSLFASCDSSKVSWSLGSVDHSATGSSFDRGLSASGRSSAGKSTRSLRKPLEPVAWSGSLLQYTFGHANSKAAVCIVGDSTLAVVASSGLCMRATSGATEVTLGTLRSAFHFRTFARHTQDLASTPPPGMQLWLSDYELLFGMRTALPQSPPASADAGLIDWHTGSCTLSGLSSLQRQLFRYIAHVVSMISAAMPRVVVRDDTCEAWLMDNAPTPDFRYWRLDDRQSVHISNRDGTCVLVDAVDRDRPVTVALTLASLLQPSAGGSGPLDGPLLALLADAQAAMGACLSVLHAEEEAIA